MGEPAGHRWHGRERANAPAAGRNGAAILRHPAAIACLATGVLALVALCAFTPRYETNDDVMMTLTVAGRTFVDRPDEHLIFSNVLLGLPLSWLYAVAPDVPWYGIGQIAALLAAAAGAAYALLRVNQSFRQLAAVVLYLGVAMLPCITQMQFTKTAFLVTLAGLLLFLAPLRGADSWSLAADCAAGLLVVLGSLIRFSSFLMAGVVVLPLAIAAGLADPRGLVRRSGPVAIALAVVSGAFLFNRAYYARDPEWKDFYAFYDARSQFTDYERVIYTSATEPALQSVGWSRTDLEMLMTWFYADRDRYSLAKMRQLLQTAPDARRSTLQQGALAMAQDLFLAPVMQQLALATLCVVMLAGTEWRRLALPVVLFGLAFGVAVVLHVYYWSPPRVLVPLFCGVVACSALGAAGGRSPARQPASRSAIILRTMACILGAGLIVRALSGLSADDAYRTQLHCDAEAMLKKLKPQPDQLYVVWREQFPFEEIVAPLEDPVLLRPMQCLSLGCLLDTPLTERRLEKFHIEDLYEAIWQRPTVRLVTSHELCGYLRRYAREHYGVKLQFSPVFMNSEPLVFILRGRVAGQPMAAPGT